MNQRGHSQQRPAAALRRQPDRLDAVEVGMSSLRSPSREALAIAAMLLMGGCGAPLAGTNPVTPSTAEQNQAALRPERNRFEQEFVPWRNLVGELRRLDVEYQTSGPAARRELKPRYDQLLAEGAGMQERVLNAAVIAYARDPSANADLGNFLSVVMSLLFQSEQYEEALRVGQLLVEGGVEAPWLYEVCGVAAFCVSEFDLAEKHLGKAKEQDSLGAIAAQCLEALPYYQQAWKAEQTLRARDLSSGDLPRVLLQTTQGEIELELFETEAPRTVANFISLVERRFYDGLDFYQVVAQFAAETGCPQGDGTGGPGYTIPLENTRPSRRLHFRGSLGMVREGAHSSGSRFYLAFRPSQELDGNPAFGRIIRGIEVLAKLQRREPPDPMARQLNPFAESLTPPADKILSAQVLRKREHRARSDTIPREPAIFDRGSTSPMIAGGARS